MADSGVGMNPWGIERLGRTNYPIWKRRIETYLKAKGWWKAIVEPSPDISMDPSKYNEWQKADAESMSVLFNSISEYQAQYVTTLDTAREIWEKLKYVNETDQMEKRLILRSRLSETRWRKDDTIQKYFDRTTTCVEELRSLGDKISEAEVTQYIINGLPKSLESVARTFEAIKRSDLQLTLVKQAVEREMTRRANDLDSGGSEIAYRTRCHQTRQKQKSKIWFTCGKSGHIARDCWHGNKNRNDSNHSTIRNGNGGRDRRFNNRYENRNNTRNRNSGTRERSNKAKSTHEEPTYYSFNVQLNRPTSPPTTGGEDEENHVQHINAVLDSGTTSHMTNRRDAFVELVERNCGSVKMADGTPRNAIGIGRTILIPIEGNGDDILILDKVLFVPALEDTLLSMSELDKSGLKLIMENGTCKGYQDEKLIFVAHERNGLYKLRLEIQGKYDRTRIERSRRVTENNLQLFHRRMAHINYRTL